MQNNRFMTCFLALTLQAYASMAVAASCGVSTTAANFGSYDVFSPSNNQTQGTVTVGCTPASTPYTIAMNPGLHGTFTQRLMAMGGGSDTLQYNLYVDTNYSIIWGDGTGSTTTVANTTGSPIQIYASAPAGQDISEGTYLDTVTITVTY